MDGTTALFPTACSKAIHPVIWKAAKGPHPAGPMGAKMTSSAKPWDAALARKWLERRYEAARLDQAAADRRGYEARDDFDKAAAEEWVCRTLKSAECVDDQAALIIRIKELIGEDEYPATGVNDDMRFERHVRTYLRKLAKMAKTNEGFEKTLRHQ
jgi:hypothetical protein